MFHTLVYNHKISSRSSEIHLLFMGLWTLVSELVDNTEYLKNELMVCTQYFENESMEFDNILHMH